MSQQTILLNQGLVFLSVCSETRVEYHLKSTQVQMGLKKVNIPLLIWDIGSINKLYNLEEMS